MPVSRKLDPQVEQELARLLSSAKNNSRRNPGGLIKKAWPALSTGALGRPAAAGQVRDQQTTDDEKEEETDQPTDDLQAQAKITSFANSSQNIIENNGLPLLGDNEFRATYDSFKKVLTSKNKATVIKEGKKLGLLLREQFAKGRFQAFIIVLIIAVGKDLWDALDPTGASGSLVNFFLGVVLFMVTFLQGAYIRRWLIKKYLWRYVVIYLIEYIPFVAIFPSYTIMVLIMKYDNHKDLKKKEAAIKEFEAEIKKIK